MTLPLSPLTFSWMWQNNMKPFPLFCKNQNHAMHTTQPGMKQPQTHMPVVLKVIHRDTHFLIAVIISTTTIFKGTFWKHTSLFLRSKVQAYCLSYLKYPLKSILKSCNLQSSGSLLSENFIQDERERERPALTGKCQGWV